ncbi:MerR family transcriptional regulator [Streptomyces sannanensis]|uniref:MerR family transcriptional regulator n=1 Tax=Streptomyces sannanensis TaxID=285536 RepID=A0ABP6S907_9ACTN
MRTGELAALVGVTPRAVRHYHHLGLLPEPARRANGYRVYGMRHAVILCRIRRLTELGLGLDEVRDVLADDAGRELVEVLGELDADLARQEAEIRERRRRLAGLLAQAEEGRLPAEGPVSAALGELLSELPETRSPSAAKDRAYLTLLDNGPAGEEIFAALRPLASDSGVLALYERLDALADASTDDPRIEPLARELVAAVPDEVLASIPADGPTVPGAAEALLADFAPAQAEVLRQVMAALLERGKR